MKLVTHEREGKEQLAILVNDYLYNMNLLDNRFPDNMADFLKGGDELMKLAHSFNEKLAAGEFDRVAPKPLKNAKLCSPAPHPTSMRDAYAFRQHVATARRNRGVEMIPEFDQFPIFYFTNHNAVSGPGEIECMPDHFEKLDFELEVAVVIGKKGINIKAADADKYIAGFLIMNDMSARTLQMEEMKLNLGPAKGKDFSTAIGPWLVTPDELEPYKTETKKGHVGNNYNLKMTCKVNDIQLSEGNMADMDWTFAEIIERCSYGTYIYPGDVIGSGTVGTGCLLELNGTKKLEDPSFEPVWIQDGDKIEMEIDGLGVLTNTIKSVKTDHSLLALKKS